MKKPRRRAPMADLSPSGDRAGLDAETAKFVLSVRSVLVTDETPDALEALVEFLLSVWTRRQNGGNVPTDPSNSRGQV
jgi:hypothetical protein